jgi:hypothetical protein
VGLFQRRGTSFKLGGLSLGGPTRASGRAGPDRGEVSGASASAGIGLVGGIAVGKRSTILSQIIKVTGLPRPIEVHDIRQQQVTRDRLGVADGVAMMLDFVGCRVPSPDQRHTIP